MNPESRPGVNSRSDIRESKKLIAIFPLIRKITRLRLRDNLGMEYALSVVSEQQPGIYLMGADQDQISPGQEDLVVKAVKASKARWRNLIPSNSMTTEEQNKQRQMEKAYREKFTS